VPAHPGLDRVIKARRCAASKVERFWLVDAVARTMECFRLVGGQYQTLAG
jgi:hypothetical protein